MFNFRDLTSWINDTKAVISQDELAKDVNGAEALLERHAEHKSEIDAREDSFRATAEAGQMLLDSGTYTGCHWKVYKCCFMKQNCHFQRGVSQYKNVAMPFSSLDIHTKHEHFPKRSITSLFEWLVTFEFLEQKQS